MKLSLLNPTARFFVFDDDRDRLDEKRCMMPAARFERTQKPRKLESKVHNLQFQNGLPKVLE